MATNEAWFVPTIDDAYNTTVSDSEVTSYGAGWHTALSFAREDGFICTPSHPVFINAPIRPSKFPLLTFENVRSFGRGFDHVNELINKTCLDATLKGDKEHKCGIRNFGEPTTDEDKKIYEDIRGKIRGLEDQIEALGEEWNKILQKSRARAEK
jgi:hypothetical protein